MTVTLSPDDSFNQALVARLHPSDWTNPDPVKRYNLVVVGAGPAGLVAAAGAAGLGAKVALIERHLMGGDCLNYGCVPSKALLHAAHKARDRDSTPDFANIMRNMREKRAALASHDSVARFSALGVDVFLGQGRFSSPTSIEVAGKQLNFHRAVIATGARAALPPIAGLSDLAPLTNETLFSLEQLPARLIVIGAGPIGCEMAQSFCHFGAQVTLIEMADRVIPTEDPEASAVLQQCLEQDGITVIVQAEVVQAAGRDGYKTVVVRDHGQERTIEADQILVAAGRIPNSDGLNLESAKVNYHRRGVTVNDRLQTTNPRIYAAGDICASWQFTHSADAMAKIILQNALFFGRKKVSALVMPWCTYTAPEVAHVGMTATEAAQKGDRITTLTVQMSAIDRAVLEQETAGFARVHIERKTGRIVGACLVSSHAGESISEISLAITSGLKMADIAATIHPYPTQAEIWKTLANAYRRESFTPRIAAVFKIFLQLFARDSGKKG